MSTFQNILVAVDFAPEGRTVLEKARELATAFGAKLTLMHVVEYSEFTYAGELGAPEEVLLERELATKAEQRLSDLRQELGLGEAEITVEIGSPKREIVRVAAERGTDLIVVGSHGRHGLQLLLGSTANGVLHLAQCGVCAVRVGT